MTTSRRKGTAAETAVVQYLRTQGWPHAERRAQSGARDTGDINLGDPAVVIEVKAVNRLELGVMVDEAETERRNAGAILGVLWHKRRGKTDPAQWYVTMPGHAFVRLLREFCGVEDAKWPASP